ncbi:hypothetical protein LX32DRAFT_346824 [Colletotrichum zoysiae]|uniref:Uncharacterized protein n=1 Tax=Colletotrichum zoysiae TaxID=1216348 RepID=A0AAD9HKR2_9PEZI|nr:hypothetical protein LX32DRAFT_346824 [Colletotrichum zoysiae]
MDTGEGSFEQMATPSIFLFLLLCFLTSAFLQLHENTCPPSLKCLRLPKSPP